MIPRLRGAAKAGPCGRSPAARAIGAVHGAWEPPGAAREPDAGWLQLLRHWEGATGSAGRTESTSEYHIRRGCGFLPRPEQRTAGVGGRYHVDFASRTPRHRAAA